jgi:hypothetical protein
LRGQEKKGSKWRCLDQNGQEQKKVKKEQVRNRKTVRN